MLIGKDRRWHKDRHLLTAHDRLERRAQCHLRFAVADIPAEQSVHGIFRLHIPPHILNGAQLTVRFLICERIGKLPAHFVVRIKPNAAGSLTPCVQLDQLLCHLTCSCLRLGFGARPFRTTHFGKLDSTAFRTGSNVFRDHIELIHREKQLVRAVIFDVYVIARTSGYRQIGKPHVHPDPVCRVNHQIADLQIRIGQDRFGGGLFAVLLSTQDPSRMALYPGSGKIEKDHHWRIHLKTAAIGACHRQHRIGSFAGKQLVKPCAPVRRLAANRRNIASIFLRVFQHRVLFGLRGTKHDSRQSACQIVCQILLQ